ncbi:hypothetical protein XH89_03275 [Bradyrhizobium sp. CCBAU 53340]|nr:hypothetical protein XH89_03275 [Bradyrhizobium sp. CCBAU 53340]
MDRFDGELRATPVWAGWETNQAHRYGIEHDGKLYPVKQIISMATGTPSANFGGGTEANNYLQTRGFKVVPLRGADASGVFLLNGEDSLLPLLPASFAKEDDFQRLLSKFPQLLVGDQVDPQNPRRWILVGRELSISTGEAGASLWSIDHVFLDQDGIPTLVELKRQSDSRIRREVVGQMLDYAASCVTYWSVDTLWSALDRTRKEAGQTVEAALNELLGPEGDADEFWQRVKTNLQAKRIRLLFVADFIPFELRRIVEFLNEQMDAVEVLAIELRQFESDELKVLVPRVYGQTQETATKRGSIGPRWDEGRLFDKLEATVGAKEMQIAKQIYEWMRKGGTRNIIFGTGKENGSVYPSFKPGGVTINPVYLSSDGKVYIQFGSLENKPVFGPIEKRRELMRRLNEIENVRLTDADLTKYPNVPLSIIGDDPLGSTKIIAALTWMEEQVQQFSG